MSRATTPPHPTPWRHAYFFIHPEIRREMRRRKAEDDSVTMRQIIHEALCVALDREDLRGAEPPDRPERTDGADGD